MEYTIKDPHNKGPDGNPACFGQYEENNYICDERCFKTLTCKLESSEEDLRREGKLFRDNIGRPTCFGKLYSFTSTECTHLCNESRECSKITDDSEFLSRGLPPTSSTAYRSEGLKVFNQPTQYTYGYRSPYSQQSNTMFQPPSINNYQIDERTNAYIKSKYGVPLKLDPTVPGQFEGEPWYERFFKEVIKYAGSYAFQLLSHIVIGSRWAPSIKKE